jgi:hypothetical protein
MRLRFLIGSLLSTLVLAVCATAQGPAQEEPKPVRIQDIRRALRVTPQTPEQIGKTNRELIAAVKARGVNFALSKEEEWALGLEEASDELIKTIREALSGEERERLLKIREQEGLYFAFVNNYAQADIGSRQLAIAAGREFVRRYRDDPNVAEIIAYLQRAVPALERSIRFMQRPTRAVPRTN